MKVTFIIDYKTSWGQCLYIVGDCKGLGENNLEKALKMEPVSEHSWGVSVELPDNTQDLDYSYFVADENGYNRQEWGAKHKFVSGKKIKNYEIFDKWNDQPYNKPFYSSAFTDGIFSRKKAKTIAHPVGKSLLITVKAPVIKDDEVLAISGNIDLLGNWDSLKALPMNDKNFPEWNINIDLEDIDGPFEYKFLILRKDKKKDLVAWENTANRVFENKIQSGNVVALNGLDFVDGRMPWKGAGTAIPVFSLRSDEDFGIGDFYDLFKMVDWAKETGQKIIQLLPINDTTMTHTWVDSYPYKANSIFALHPMYLRPDRVGKLKDKKKTKAYDETAKRLNALPTVDYEAVNQTKISYLHDIYNDVKSTVLEEADFKNFIKANEYWLKPYAAFSLLRDLNKTPDFNEWGFFAKYDENSVDAFCRDNSDEINFIYFLQYHLDKQLREVRNYAHANGVVLKGDIPIGISRTSVDAWMYPSLFYMDCQAGAPPDDFSVLGQNWGFPTYNWKEMNKDGFQWWKNRFKKMAEYFDAYRIDHILGFFRIWQIPLDAVHGLLGTFQPALPFSSDEMRNQYDFWINPELHTNPYIRDYFLYDFFGEYTDEVKSEYLVSYGNGAYGLKEFANTQKKVDDIFTAKPKDAKNNRIKDALMGLIDEVLFIEDKEEKGKYHPRIAAQNTFIYRSMNDYERWCFDKLYNDFYYHRHNDFWYGKAMWKLPPIINATNMLVCGEDLGMIPDCVEAVMKSQQILSLEIQRMPKDPKQEFGNPAFYPYDSVCTTSTHDMSGIRGWWEENRDKTQHFYNNMIHEGGEAPMYAEPWICDKIVCEHLYSPAMFTILPLQDWLSVSGDLRREDPNEEQINVPANPKHYWRYRMHLTLETLLEQKIFNKSIKDRVVNSGR